MTRRTRVIPLAIFIFNIKWMYNLFEFIRSNFSLEYLQFSKNKIVKVIN